MVELPVTTFHRLELNGVAEGVEGVCLHASAEVCLPAWPKTPLLSLSLSLSNRPFFEVRGYNHPPASICIYHALPTSNEVILNARCKFVDMVPATSHYKAQTRPLLDRGGGSPAGGCTGGSDRSSEARAVCNRSLADGR